MNKSIDVAVVIVTYNSQEQIETCLRSLYERGGRTSKEVIVVDNNSRDNTVQLIQREFPEVKLVLPGENLGFAKGVNLGVRHSNADFVLLLNPDTEVLEDAIDTIVEFAREHPEYGLYGGRTFSPDGKLEPSSCWGAPTLWSMALFAFGISKLAPRNAFLDPESLGDWKRDTVREVGVITGCLLLTPIEVWNRLGGMDERFFMYGEDADFSMRARQLGYRPVICPDAKVVHEIGKSSDTPIHKLMLLYRGKASLVRRHWTGPGRALGIFFLAAGTALRAAAGIVGGLVRGARSPGRWQMLWNQRKDWLGGYRAGTDVTS
jgi:N-acetylglucosaminyl-diphospho-decaprenol L-rhamnosyltransferase